MRHLGTPPDDVEAFLSSVVAYTKEHILPTFDKFEFYVVPLHEWGGL